MLIFPSFHVSNSLFLFFLIFCTGAIPGEKPAAHVPPKAAELSGPRCHEKGKRPRPADLLTSRPVSNQPSSTGCITAPISSDPLSLVQDFLSAEGKIAGRVDGMGNSVTKQPSRQLFTCKHWCQGPSTGEAVPWSDLPVGKRSGNKSWLCKAGGKRGCGTRNHSFESSAGDSATCRHSMLKRTGCGVPQLEAGLRRQTANPLRASPELRGGSAGVFVINKLTAARAARIATN